MHDHTLQWLFPENKSVKFWGFLLETGIIALSLWLQFIKSGDQWCVAFYDWLQP